VVIKTQIIFKIGTYENKFSFGKTLKPLDLTKIEDINLLLRESKKQIPFLISSIKGIKQIKKGKYSIEEITLIEYGD